MDRRKFMGLAVATGVVGTALKTRTTLRVEVERNGRWFEVPEGLLVIRQGDHFRTMVRDPEMLWCEGTAVEDGHYGRDANGDLCGEVDADLTVADGIGAC